MTKPPELSGEQFTIQDSHQEVINNKSKVDLLRPGIQIRDNLEHVGFFQRMEVVDGKPYLRISFGRVDHIVPLSSIGKRYHLVSST